MKFSRELLLDAHQGTVLLDVSVLAGIVAERQWRRGAEGAQEAVLAAASSLPRRSLFFIGQSKHGSGNLCLPPHRGHHAKRRGANRSETIKKEAALFSTEGCRRDFPARERHAGLRNPGRRQGAACGSAEVLRSNDEGRYR